MFVAQSERYLLNGASGARHEIVCEVIDQNPIPEALKAFPRSNGDHFLQSPPAYLQLAGKVSQ